MDIVEKMKEANRYCGHLGNDPLGAIIEEGYKEIERLRTERDLLFKAHSHELVRADVAEQEIEQLRAGHAHQLAQLRHAYAQLKAGRVTRQEEFADGLIAPAIRWLEQVNPRTSRPTSSEG